MAVGGETEAPKMTLRCVQGVEWSFGGIFALCMAFFIAPLWIGPLVPVLDFGSNLVMVDAYVRYDELPGISGRLVRQSGFIPNILAAQFADLLYPWLDPRQSLRVWLSFSLVFLAGSLVLVCKVFERSKWQVFVALPWIWSGVFATGMVHFSMALPEIMLGLCLSRMSGLLPGKKGWACALLLGGLGILSFLTHGIGCLFFLSTSLGMLLISLRRLRDAVRILVLAPTALVWGNWLKNSSGDSARIPGGLEVAFSEGAMWREPLDAMRWALRQAHDVLESQVDSQLFLGGLAVWLVLMVAGQRQVVRTRGVYASLRQHAFLLYTLALAAAVFVIPAQIQRTSVSSRLISLALLCFLLLPSGTLRSGIERVAIVVSIALCLMYGVHLTTETARFDREQVAPLMALLEQIPEGSRVECVEVCPETGDTVFIRRPFCHGCGGLAAVERDAYTGGGGFAHNSFNAIRFRPGHGYRSVRRRPWATHVYTRQWDYILQRGTQTWEQFGQVERIGLSEVVGTSGRRWSLYRVQDPHPDRVLAEEQNRAVNNPEGADATHEVDGEPSGEGSSGGAEKTQETKSRGRSRLGRFRHRG